jgi:hypothetical protein
LELPEEYRTLQLEGNVSELPIDNTDIDKLFTKIQRMTEEYIEDHHELNAETNNKMFFFTNTLKNALSNENETKRYRLKKFVQILQKEDQNILNQHRTDAWKRYLVDVLSVLTVLPGLVRTAHSYYKYSTVQFWKPTSEKVKMLALDECKKLDISEQKVLF